MPSGGKRLGRATAGREVSALAQKFSQSLLGDENAAFDAVDLVFAKPVPGLRTKVTAAVEKAEGEPSRLRAGSPLTGTLRSAHAECMKRAETYVQALAETSHRKASDAILAELQVCEATLSPRYDGIADAAVERMNSTRTGRIERHMIAYRKAVAGLSPDFGAQATLQYREAVDERTLLLRLFSVDPAGLRGFGGRGVWWRTVTDLRVSIRTVSIGVANETRLDAMRAFNAVYDEKD